MLKCKKKKNAFELWRAKFKFQIFVTVTVSLSEPLTYVSAAWYLKRSLCSEPFSLSFCRIGNYFFAIWWSRVNKCCTISKWERNIVDGLIQFWSIYSFWWLFPEMCLTMEMMTKGNRIRALVLPTLHCNHSRMCFYWAPSIKVPSVLLITEQLNE